MVAEVKKLLDWSGLTKAPFDHAAARVVTSKTRVFFNRRRSAAGRYEWYLLGKEMRIYLLIYQYVTYLEIQKLGVEKMLGLTMISADAYEWHLQPLEHFHEIRLLLFPDVRPLVRHSVNKVTAHYEKGGLKYSQVRKFYVCRYIPIPCAWINPKISNWWISVKVGLLSCK